MYIPYRMQSAFASGDHDVTSQNINRVLRVSEGFFQRKRGCLIFPFFIALCYANLFREVGNMILGIGIFSLLQFHEKLFFSNFSPNPPCQLNIWRPFMQTLVRPQQRTLQRQARGRGMLHHTHQAKGRKLRKLIWGVIQTVRKHVVM